MKKRILVVEDDESLACVLRDNLVFAGFDVEWVPDGDLALQSVRTAAPDLILLDVMLPRHDGFELCGLLSQGSRTPIIILSARGQKADRINGLKLGADDYVTKPFHFEELLARIRAVLRRARPAVDSLVIGQMVVDFRHQQASAGGRACHLTHREFEVLHYLAEREGRVVSRSELLREVWGYLDVPLTRAVDHAVARLRKKIEIDPHQPRFIHTVHGDGYCLTVRETSTASLPPGVDLGTERADQRNRREQP
jgi:DNA-binding response OmpR family regulator